MIELLTADTPNGKKISIMLEEIGFEYKVTKINLILEENFQRVNNLILNLEKLVLLVKFQ